MEYTKITNLKNNEHGGVDCTVDFKTIGSVPFTANSSDTSEHGKNIWAEIGKGKWGKVLPYVGVGIDALRAMALTKVAIKHAEMLGQLSGNATIEERDTWTLKLSIAQASVDYGEPTEEAVIMFNAESEADEVDVMEKCRRVVAYNRAYIMLIGIASGIKTRAENAVKVAVDDSTIKIILDSALVEAQTAAQQYLIAIGRTE